MNDSDTAFNAVDAFLTRHRQVLELSCPELASALARGLAAIRTVEAAASVPELRALYAFRADRLSRFDTSHTRALRFAALSLCEALDRASEPACRVWVIELGSEARLVVFEGSESGDLLGALHLVSSLGLSPDRRRELWGPGHDPLCPNCGSVITTGSVQQHADTCGRT